MIKKNNAKMKVNTKPNLVNVHILGDNHTNQLKNETNQSKNKCESYTFFIFCYQSIKLM